MIHFVFQLHEGCLQKKQLHYLHGSWLTPRYSVTLYELDISNNFIKELPACLPWDFQNLRHMNASHNLLKTLTWPMGEDRDIECCRLVQYVCILHSLEVRPRIHKEFQNQDKNSVYYGHF